MNKRKKIFYWTGGIVGFFVLVTLSWMVMETSIEVSSHADFCIVCHAMEPMVKSYHDSVHGGNNPRGIMAACTDCHTSHTNVVSQLYTKARSGTHDIWVTVTRDESTLDWQEKRTHHDEFVYDSGCLSCHRNLEQVTAGHGEHAKYFAGLVDSQCVDCHEGVGHENLNMYLLEAKYRYHFEK